MEQSKERPVFTEYPPMSKIIRAEATKFPVLDQAQPESAKKLYDAFHDNTDDTVERYDNKRFSVCGIIKSIAAGFTHLFNNLIAVTMNCLRLPETVSLQQELIEPGDLHNLPNLFTDTCHLEPAFILQRLIHHKKDTKASR